MYPLYQQAKLVLDFINKLSIALGSVQIDRNVYMLEKFYNFFLIIHQEGGESINEIT